MKMMIMVVMKMMIMVVMVINTHGVIADDTMITLGTGTTKDGGYARSVEITQPPYV